MIALLPTYPPMDHAIPVLRPCPRGCGRQRFYFTARCNAWLCGPCKVVDTRTYRARHPERYAALKARITQRQRERRRAAASA